MPSSDETTSRTLLHMLLDNSDIPEMLCLHCFPQLLQQRIDEVYHRRKLSPSIGRGARVSAFPTDPLAQGSARESASAHASVRTTSSYTDGMRISSESGSGIQTPSPEIEDIIKALLSNKWEQAARGFRNIYHGGGSGTPTTQLIGITKEATSTEMILSSALERTTALLSSKTLDHDGRGSNAEKVKFSTFKDAGHSAGQTSIEAILWTWETEFASAGLPPNVSRVIGLMLPGANLSNWKDTFRSVTRDLHDPEDIRNWTWERFGKELYKSPMYLDADKKQLLDVLKKVACKDPGHSDEITTYDNAFTLALQNLRLYHLDSTFSPAQQAQMYYDNLPPLIRIQYSVFSNCSATVTVSPSGPIKLFKGGTTAMSGVLARFPWLLPVRNPSTSYGASAVTRTRGRGHVAEVKKPISSGWCRVSPSHPHNAGREGFPRNHLHGPEGDSGR
jgi:hypothetical protein